MNRDPNYNGITRYWKPGEDDRLLLAKETRLSFASVDMFLDGLWRLVSSRRRTKFVGVGVFEWRPWRCRLPNGKHVRTWRLVFRPSRYAERYRGGRK